MNNRQRRDKGLAYVTDASVLVETLRPCLAKHAGTQAQFEKSYRDLTEKVRVTESVN